NLSNSNLSEACLSSARLQDGNLRGAHLAGADLAQSKLTNTQFVNANLQFSRLHGSSIIGTNFLYANLKGADLRSLYMDDVNFEGADLTDAIFSDELFDVSTNVRLPDGTLLTEGRDLKEFGVEARRIVGQTRADDPDAETFTFADGTQRRWKLGEGWLDAPNTKRANLSGTYLRDDFTEVDFHRVNLSNSHIQDASFQRANLRGANLSGTHIERVTFTGADLTDADLTGMFIIKYMYERAFLVTNYSRVIFDETTILPDGTNWSPERDLAEFGAETRTIAKSERVDPVNVHTFEDGTQRRWKLGEGWLD
ncbi:MAG: pentapeptide repeat-containing protein, partial [Aggregatilineales bacterium]